MTVVSITSVGTILGVPGVADATVWASFVPWAGKAPATRVDGADVVFPTPIRVRIKGSGTVEVAESDGSFCWQIKLEPVTKSLQPLTRYVTVEGAEVDFGALPVVDPETFLPLDPFPPSAQEILETSAEAAAASEAAALAAAGSADAAAAAASSTADVADDVEDLVELTGEGRLSEGALAVAFAGQAPMGIVLPSTATYADIQAACNSAATFGTRVWAAGTITTSSTLVISSDADLGGLTINYTGSGRAVQLGAEAAVTFRLNVTLPRVIASNKVLNSGWAAVAGTVGVYAVNLNSCSEIVVTHVQDFETGLLVYGKGQGCAYNTFLIGHLANNKVNLRVSADASGWSNQNTYIGGRYGHNTAEGSEVSGARQIEMVAGLANPINNNAWVNPSLEGNTAEFIVDFAGQANLIQSGRWEASVPRVRWQNASLRNLILWGYNAHQIVETFGTGTANTIVASSSSRWSSSSLSPLLTMENAGSAAYPIIALMEAGARAAGADPTTAYAVSLGSQMCRFKRGTDTQDRVQIDASNGRVYFGSGSVAPTRYLANLGTTSVVLTGGHFVFGADSTNDIGLSGSNRPRDYHVGRNIVQAAGYHDIAEMTAPAAPAANTARLYVDDNGAGKTRLMVRFPTGAAVQLAIEP